MTDMRGKFHVVADDESGNIKINGKYRMREDMVRLSNGSADVRYRAEYPSWTAKVRIRYNSRWITAAQLANLLNMAGFSCGIGEWRPEKSASGCWGMYQVVDKNK
jgi:hypothetical protein